MVGRRRGPTEVAPAWGPPCRTVAAVIGRATALLLAVALCGAAVGCSESEPPDTPAVTDDAPGLDRIEGPAEVDPSYDPFAVDTTSVP